MVQVTARRTEDAPGLAESSDQSTSFSVSFFEYPVRTVVSGVLDGGREYHHKNIQIQIKHLR